MNKNILAIGIIILFILSALAPITFGTNVRTTIEKEVQSSVTSNGGLQDSAWPMFQHDVKHTGQSPYGKSGNWRVEKWKFKIDDSMMFSSPAIDNNGTIYIGSSPNKPTDYLYAINPNGTLKWGFNEGDWIKSSPAIGEDGTIYVGSLNGQLYAIYPNGTKKWSLQIGDGWVRSSPVIDEDGVVYVASVNGYNICAVYPNGTKKWDFVTDFLVYSSPVLDGAGAVYCGSHDGFMYAIYTSNGTLKWRYDTGNWCGGAGATIGDDGIIYFGAVDGCLYALYSNGTRKWKLSLGSNVYSSPAISEDGTIYVAAYKGVDGAYMCSINPNGSINWKYELDALAMSTSPAIDKYGIIYMGDWDGISYAFNPNGTIRWTFSACGSIRSSSAINEDGIIYFGAHDTSQPEFYSYLYAIEVIDNDPPEKPSIDGPVNGKIRTEYTFTAVSTDSDGDNVSYFFDWGDGTDSGWTEFVPSGSSISRNHSWQHRGTYTVRVKAKDEFCMEGDWETITVTMPRDKAITNSLLLWFLERFPLLERLLNVYI